MRDDQMTAPKVNEVEPRGLEYEVDAIKDGRPVKALVDATTGEVKSEIGG